MKFVNPIKIIKKAIPKTVEVECYQTGNPRDGFDWDMDSWCPVCTEATPEKYFDAYYYCPYCGQYLKPEEFSV